LKFLGKLSRQIFTAIFIFIAIALAVNVFYMFVWIIQNIYESLESESLLFQLIDIFSSLNPYKTFDYIAAALLITTPLFSLVLFFLEFIVTNLTKISTVKVQKLVFALFLPTTLTIWLTMIFDETGFNFVVSIISFLALLYPQIEKN
jgi:hypothetical protein